MKYYIDAFRNYTNFKGVLNRKGYWMYVLFYSFFVLIMIALDNLYGTDFKVEGQSLGYGYFYLIFVLINMLPGLSVSVRRLHDIGKSGLFILIGLIPLIGAIWLLIVLCKESEVKQIGL